MSESPSAGPIESAQRVHALDALRGFALLGVFISNSLNWFNGRLFLPKEQALALAASPLELTVNSLFALLIEQKFVTLFTLLFGLGFALQMTRAEGRGTSIVPVYRRRLLVLLGIGLVHMFAIWLGDILTTYALVGFLLLSFRQCSEKTVLVWAALFLFVVPTIFSIGQRVLPVMLDGAAATERAQKATKEEDAERRAAFLAGLSSDSVVTSQQANAAYGWASIPNPNRPVLLSIILGRFLLGLWAGRRGLLQDVERHRPLLRKLAAWGLGVGSVIGLVVLALNLTYRGVTSLPGWLVWMRIPKDVGILFLGVGFAAAFVLLFQKERWRKVLGVFTPAGRMALTLYLMQSVLSITLYDGWGLGLVGRTPPSLTVVFSLLLFAGQVAFSHWWLARFRFGPVEWLWRSLTYGRAQTMRLGPTAAHAVN
ncbi:DUF418 domain-containing protein [Corallococcus exiguus]|uniref:DUF418 domain-containing protein n=1 Tax=Corallococcus TaxID=83461 RepID=UPI000EC93647|nr:MULTISPECIES: DUF418 domain-containing protein [Corallococcus]NNB87681.1 DUF418 domain-containing protein [Corallococcus exiguus]NNB95420.1 DUF418 domain-containing protein [Corallococcus exiguus]NPC48294.1 DUF418 domain-containing protein [Corallococcus exiguus]RKH76618.1 DUF418 domain-containing protein [Corallococcus sp. AB032C]